MTVADHWEPLSAGQQTRLRKMLQASVIRQIELWNLRSDLADVFELGDDDEFDNLLNDLIGNFAVGVPDGTQKLGRSELNRLVMEVEDIVDECRNRL